MTDPRNVGDGVNGGVEHVLQVVEESPAPLEAAVSLKNSLTAVVQGSVVAIATSEVLVAGVRSAKEIGHILGLVVDKDGSGRELVSV